MKSLKEIRESKGIKQAYVAEQLGISRQTLSRYEADQDNLTIGQAKALCHILGCELTDIFLLTNVN